MQIEVIRSITAQHESEIVAFCNFIVDRDGDGLKTILEIGTFKGGTAYIFSQIALNKVITIDLRQNQDGRNPLLQKLKTKVPIIEVMGISSAPATIQAVKNLLGDDLVDLLFIDGPHGYEEVKADFINYSTLVRDGGWIAFHDIIHFPSAGEAACEVHRLWEEIKGDYPFLEFIFHRQDPDKQRTTLNPSVHMGIGLLQWIMLS